MSNDESNVAADQLRAFIERVERLEEEKKEIADDIKDVYGEAKSFGYDVKVMRKLIAIRKQDQNERQEQEAILELYMVALGMGIQERLPLADEDLRVRRPARREKSRDPVSDAISATIQILDDNGAPMHPPVSIDTVKAAVAKVKSGGRKRKPVDATDADDEKLRNERAKGPVFA